MTVPRPAATIVVVRQCAEGVEVVVLERASGSRFLPGYVVFPGGALDESDVQTAARWFGSGDQAARACAVRELLEEAGLALTADGLREARGSDGFASVSASPPFAEMLREISHWIAPEDVPVRFDARFFALRAGDGLEPSPDGTEAERAWWARPTDILEAFAGKGLRLYWPTMKVMQALAGCRSVDEVLELHVPQVEPD